MQQDKRRLHKFADSHSSIESKSPHHNYDQPIWFLNLHHIFQKSVATTSNLVATIQASRASECQYRKLAAAIAAMESKLSYWRSVDLDIHSIQAAKTSTSLSSRNGKPANWSWTLA